VATDTLNRLRLPLCWALAAWAALLSFPADAALILQLRVVEGEGVVYSVGGRATRGLTVLVTDETGNPVDGATVSFSLPLDGPGGVFPSGGRTELARTQADGRATVWGMQWNKIPGPFQIRITAMKDQARAGVVSTQYLTDAAVPRPGGEGTFSASRHGRNKWILIGAVAGGAAAGLAFGRSQPHTAAAAGPAALRIGAPSLTVGHP
jgi:hypothetical protein